MPATIPHICPHCGHDNIVFTVKAEIPWEKEACQATHPHMLFQTLVTCGNCGMAAVAILKRQNQATPTPINYPGQYNIAAGSLRQLELVRFFPTPTPKEPPRHLPPKIEQAMREAYKARDSRSLTAAAIMTRKAIELALAHIGVESNDPLAARIERASSSGMIAPPLAEWAHEVRLVGNDAAHGDMLDPDAEEDRNEVDQALSFAEMFLQYAITLPEEIRRRREDR